MGESNHELLDLLKDTLGKMDSSTREVAAQTIKTAAHVERISEDVQIITKALFLGNGKPSLSTRIETSEREIDDIHKGFKRIERKIDRNHEERRKGVNLKRGHLYTLLGAIVAAAATVGVAFVKTPSS